MNRFSIKTTVLVTAAVVAGMGSPLYAATRVDGNVSLGLEYTDNAGLTETNEVDDLIATGSLSASISEDAGPVTGNADASIRQVDYLDNTFGKQTYLQLDTDGKWEPIQNRIEFRVRDYFTQNSIDNLSSNTPSNTEDTNAFDLAAAVTFPVADRHTLTITPSFRDFYYKTTPNDNQQISLDAGWAYQLDQTITLSLYGGYSEVDYDSNPGYESTTLGLSADVIRARSRYALRIGVTNIERDLGADVDGVNGNVVWDYDITERSTITAYAASDLTDSSNVFLSSSVDPNTGSFYNIQVSSDVLRSNVFRVTYRRQDAVIGARAWVELRDVDYEVDPLDREVQEVGASISYDFTSRLTGSVNGRYLRTEESGIVRTDKISRLGGQLNYQLSRKLSANVRVRGESKDSTSAGSGYDELAVFAGVGYRLGR